MSGSTVHVKEKESDRKGDYNRKIPSLTCTQKLQDGQFGETSHSMFTRWIAGWYRWS